MKGWITALDSKSICGGYGDWSVWLSLNRWCFCLAPGGKERKPSVVYSFSQASFYAIIPK
jgi:hypothetical protein